MEEGDNCHLWLAVLFLYIIPSIQIVAFLKIYTAFLILLSRFQNGRYRESSPYHQFIVSSLEAPTWTWPHTQFCTTSLITKRKHEYSAMWYRKPVASLELQQVYVSRGQFPGIRTYDCLNTGFPCIVLYRPVGLQEIEVPRNSRQSAHESGKGVSSRHRPPLPP